MQIKNPKFIDWTKKQSDTTTMGYAQVGAYLCFLLDNYTPKRLKSIYRDMPRTNIIELHIYLAGKVEEVK
jgi:hypothetical protein